MPIIQFDAELSVGQGFDNGASTSILSFELIRVLNAAFY